MDLSQKHCVPCEGGIEPLTPEGVSIFIHDLAGWSANEDSKKISKTSSFKNFKTAMVFVNKVAEIAEEEGHHPDITINWNKVTLELTTHAIKGLSENDFILATKIEKI